MSVAPAALASQKRGANVRLLASTGCALAAIDWLDLGAAGVFVAIAGGFCAYAALTSAAIFKVKAP
jgi:hypothetical protein